MKTTTLKPAHLGSISHGTLHTEDLLEAFGKELEWQIQRNDFLSMPENFQLRDHLNNALGQWQDATDDDENIVNEDDALELVNETLPDALQAFCGPYCYFGSHPGDGADFGFWASHEQIDELPTVEDSDEAKALGEDCKSVNDHGNVTVYGGDGSVILELV